VRGANAAKDRKSFAKEEIPISRSIQKELFYESSFFYVYMKMGIEANEPPQVK
jgi:hypothetical protein